MEVSRPRSGIASSVRPAACPAQFLVGFVLCPARLAGFFCSMVAYVRFITGRTAVRLQVADRPREADRIEHARRVEAGRAKLARGGRQHRRRARLYGFGHHGSVGRESPPLAEAVRATSWHRQRRADQITRTGGPSDTHRQRPDHHHDVRSTGVR